MRILLASAALVLGLTACGGQNCSSGLFDADGNCVNPGGNNQGDFEDDEDDD